MMGFTDQAIDAYQRSVELNADSPSVWESLGQIYKQKENFTQADFAFRRLSLIKQNGCNHDVTAIMALPYAISATFIVKPEISAPPKKLTFETYERIRKWQ